MELDKKTYKKIKSLCEKGDQLAEEDKYDHAIREYKAALDLLPEPKDEWEAGTLIHTAIGDAWFFKGDYENACNSYYDSINCPDGITNPYILLRLGESMLECGNTDKAREFLLRAYMLEGEDIFEDEDEKYYSLIEDLTEETDEVSGMDILSGKENAELTHELREKLDGLMSESNSEWDKRNHIKSIMLLEEAWKVLPEPKGIYSDSYHIVKYIIESYLHIAELHKAKEWAEKLFFCDLKRIDSGEREFLAGKIAFEMDELQEAKEYFGTANRKSHGRCFEDEGKNYIQFFNKR